MAKRQWTIASAVRELDAELVSETVYIVPVPFKGLKQCGAFDYLCNHTSYSVIRKVKNTITNS